MLASSFAPAVFSGSLWYSKLELPRKYTPPSSPTGTSFPSSSRMITSPSKAFPTVPGCSNQSCELV